MLRLYRKILKHYGCICDDVISENIFTINMALFIENGAYRNTIYTKQFPTGSNLGVKELAVHKSNKQYVRRVMALGDFLATPLQKTPKSPPEGKLMYPCKVQSNSTQHIIRTVSAMWGAIKSEGPLGYELEPSMVE